MAKKYNIAVIPGDGIGPEITKAAIDVLEAATSKREIEIFTKELKAGGAAVDLYGIPLPQETIESAKDSDAVLLGAVGGPKWDNVDPEIRPEKALLGLRFGLGLYANIRPVTIYDELNNIHYFFLSSHFINGSLGVSNCITFEKFNFIWRDI
ncbi:MAG: hypothetical protein II438_02100 [Clostridiales bacterium]|nr:hypothetical protein [Clostridiales bacterium]